MINANFHCHNAFGNHTYLLGSSIGKINDSAFTVRTTVNNGDNYLLVVRQVLYEEFCAEGICAMSANKGVVMQACATTRLCACRPF